MFLKLVKIISNYRIFKIRSQSFRNIIAKHLDADLDPSFHLNADPEQSSYLDKDPDQSFNLDEDLD